MITVSIIGGSGYSGIELLSLLLRHPQVSVSKVFANSSAGKRVDELYPKFRGVTSLHFESFTYDSVSQDDLIFCALPSGEAMSILPGLLDRGKRIIDLGGDFRLQDVSLYQQYYRHDHHAVDHLKRAVYGLPEWNSDIIRSAQIVANPGCYVTSALLPLLPLIKEQAIRPDGIIIDSMSGVSGAGRKASVDYSFTELNETVKAYKVGVHQHVPEIESVLKDIGGAQATVTFVPHLIPITRGIYTTIYATPTSEITADSLSSIYSKHYARAPFVRLLGAGVPEIRSVNYTNFIDIGWTVFERNNHIILLSVIDNLVKGAAGQAVQNMNIMFGFTESEGLL